MLKNGSPQTGDVYLQFNGRDSYVEIPSIADYSASTNGELTIAAWIKPDTLNFPSVERTRLTFTGLAKEKDRVLQGIRSGLSECITIMTLWTVPRDQTGSAFTCLTQRADWALAAMCKSRFTEESGCI